MSLTFGSLLSNSGTNALNKYQNSYSYNKYSGKNESYMSILGGIATKNAYGEYKGFSSSIFTNSSGIQQQSASSTSLYGSNDWQTGKDGLNRRGPVSRYLTNSSNLPKTDNPYANGAFGASIVDNYLTSIQHVALGQYAPTSVFEQRLNYHLSYDEQNKPGAMLGNTANYMNVDSVNYNANNKDSGYNYLSNLDTATSSSNLRNIFTDRTSSAATPTKAQNATKATTVSSLMSMLA